MTAANSKPIAHSIFHAVAMDGDTIVAVGTAFAISSRLLLTCAHCVEGATSVALVAEDEILQGNRGAKSRIRAKDDRLDLALLDVSFDLPCWLSLANSYPQRGCGVRTWRSDDLLGDEPQLGPVWGLFGKYWEGSTDQVPMISLTVSSVGGMSGGPILDPNDRVIGVFASSFDVDGDQVAFNWRENIEPILGPVNCEAAPPLDELVAEHLDIGIGLGIAAPTVREFVASVTKAFPDSGMG